MGQDTHQDTTPAGQDTRLPQLPQGAATPRPHPGRHLTPREPVRSLYIHVPFCFHKCHYCDFYSIVDTQDRQGVFTDRLCRELRALAPWTHNQPLQTIFIGGGTPSLLRVDLWKQLLGALHAHFNMSALAGAHPRAEFSVECNPETVSPELMRTLRAGGVNRVSIGAQTFHEEHLKTLERWHNPANVLKAITLARDAGISRTSLDLIFAIPGQTMSDWEADLRTALGAGTEHISCYALTYEPSTALTARLARGLVTRADEDLEADMFERTLQVLRGAGLDRYEVSNFARPGAECRHNLAYWRQEQWLAAGPAASAHVGGARWKNTPRLDDYLSQEDDGFAPCIDFEPPDAARALTERIMTGLRLREGLDAQAILHSARALHPRAEESLARCVQEEVRRGNLVATAQRTTLTDQGFLVADRVILSLVSALDERGT